MEEARDLVFADFSLGDASDRSFERWLSSDKRDSVQLEENKRGHGARALVAIDERVILHDMEKVGCGHFKQVRVKILPAEASLGRCHRRLQKTHVSDAQAATIPLDHIPVDLDYLVQSKEGDRHRSISEALQSFAITTVSLLKRRAKSLLPGGVSDRRDD